MGDRSVVMGHKDAFHNLLLVPALLVQLQLFHAVPRRSALAPFEHRRRVLVLAETLDTDPLENRALREGDKPNVVVRFAKVEYAEALATVLVNGWLDDAVNRSLVVSTRKELHHIAGIDNLG